MGKYLLYYTDLAAFTADQGNAEEVTSIVPAVAYVEDTGNVAFNYLPGNKITAVYYCPIGNCRVPLFKEENNDFLSLTIDGEYFSKYDSRLEYVDWDDNYRCVYTFNEPGYHTVIIEIPGNPADLFTNYNHYGANYLVSVSFGEGITALGYDCCAGCNNLTSVTIPNTVVLIDEYAFDGCLFQSQNFTCPASLSAATNNYWGGTIITEEPTNGLFINDENNAYACRITSSAVTIPSSVTGIFWKCFESCVFQSSNFINNTEFDAEENNYWGATVYDVHQADGLWIRNNIAFKCDTTASSVTIPSSVTSIRDNAFYRCISLTSITIPSSVVSIGNSAFDGCTSLTGITIPSSVTGIGYDCFYDCAFQSSNFINNSSLDAEENYYWGATVYDTHQADGLWIRNNNAFKCDTTATTVTVPNSVTGISSSCFGQCSSLETLTIGSGVTEIGGSWLPYFTDRVLKTVILNEGLSAIGEKWFSGATTLTSVTIPNSVTSIGNSAFTRCTHLTSITIPSSVTNIGNNAFRDCTGLSSIVIPSSVIGVGTSAFSGVFLVSSNFTNNSSLDAAANNYWGAKFVSVEQADGLLISGNTAFSCRFWASSVTIPQTVNSISGLCFSGTSIKSITIPTSVTGIGIQAFLDTPITSINIPDSVTSAGTGFLEGCTSLTSITIGTGLTYIPASAFCGCDSLLTITIPDVVTRLDGYAFYICYSLTSITIGSGVTSIGNYTFNNCHSLIDITIPNSVTSIGDYVFNSCRALTAITLGSGLTRIGTYGFQNLNSLKQITCLAPIAPDIQNSTFNSIISNGTLYYPQGSDYSYWMRTNNYYLGKYNWTSQPLT